SFHPDRPELFLTTPYQTVVRKLAIESPVAAGPIPNLGEPTALSLPTNFLPHWITLSRNAQTLALSSIFEGRTFVADLATPDKVVWLKNLIHLSRGEVETP